MTRISNFDSPLSQNLLDQINRAAQMVGDTARNISTAAQSAVQNPLRVALTSVEVRTTVAPPIKYTADELWGEIQAPPNPNSVSRFIKPTIQVNSPLFGKRVFAPYGAAGEREWESFHNKLWLYGLLGVAGLVGIGIALGVNAAKKQR